MLRRAHEERHSSKERVAIDVDACGVREWSLRARGRGFREGIEAGGDVVFAWPCDASGDEEIPDSE